MGAFHHPTISAKALAAFDPASGNAGPGAPLAALAAAAPVVVRPGSCPGQALVGMELVGTPPRPAALAATHRRNGVERRGEHHAVVLVGRSDQHAQRRASCVDDEVALAARLAPVGRIGPCRGAPFLLAQWRCPGWHGASRPAPRRASAPTRRGAAPPRPRHPANHASAASNSSPSRTPSRRAASSRAGPNAARTGCRSGPPGFRSAGVHSSGAAWAVAAREQSRAKDRQQEAVGPCHLNAPQPVLLGALRALPKSC